MTRENAAAGLKAGWVLEGATFSLPYWNCLWGVRRQGLMPRFLTEAGQPSVPCRDPNSWIVLTNPQCLSYRYKLCVLHASKGRAIFNNSEFGTRKDLFKEKVQLKKMKELTLRSILKELKFGNLDGQRKGGWVRQEVGNCKQAAPKGSQEKAQDS